MPGTVTTWMGDCLLSADRYICNHLGKDSLPSFRGRLIKYQPVCWAKAGCVHLCQVTGNTVRSQMASDIP